MSAFMVGYSFRRACWIWPPAIRLSILVIFPPADFAGGDRSDPVLVTLYLNGCLKGSGHTLRDFPGQTSEMPELAYSTVERGVSMTMMAEGAPENSDLGRIRGDVRGAGIRLLTERKQLIHLNQPQRMWILKPGDNAIHFLAALESFGREVTAGEFNGLVRLKLEYL